MSVDPVNGRKKSPTRVIYPVAAPGRQPPTGGPTVQRLAIVATHLTETNRQLLEAAVRLGMQAIQLGAPEAQTRLRAGDHALGRLDVLPTLDGPEPGLEELRALEDTGVLVVNRAGALVGAHDKLVTALRLAARSLPHPRTAHVGDDADPGFRFPVVVKPRFGSWGKDVVLCESRSALLRCLRATLRREWFRRQGAIVQEQVPPLGRDLRVLVAAGKVVGAVERVAAAGEWRTNVALGGTRRRVEPPPGTCRLAVDAADALGVDLAGVDLLPDGAGGYVVLELNGAVDFTREYALGGDDVFERAIRALEAPARYAPVRDETEEAPLAVPAGARA